MKQHEPGDRAITEQRLREIEDRLRAATPGPWRAEDQPGSDDVRVVGRHNTTGEEFCISLPFTPHGYREANAELIANAPVDLADLVVEVRRLRATLGGR
jgi:hypothetical protein